ncbi:acyclic terpene utilization AtuA family protein [Castellaniella sp. FW104-16D08]|uniref:acyclic terpene utilization AtuA family protein n=1 Tax=unclassified Castellaniella TaxID=2617606 RepID=UPI003314A288
MYLIGSGAGFSGDRTDAAQAVVASIIASGHPGAVIFETLGERTLALGQVAKRSNKDKGYEPLLADIVTPILADCLRAGIAIVGNFGAANPQAAARLIQQIARDQGFTDTRIAVITGDDLLDGLDLTGLEIWEGDTALHSDTGQIVSANVYIGARSIADALRAGAQIVVAGRVADPALVVGPAMAHYGWAWDDWDRLAQATLAGHLLECGAQVTGGYFADPGYKDVPSPATIGYPIAEIQADASFVITKAGNTGGLVDLRTVKEQILYEIHDPAAYLTPDVVLDITDVTLEPTSPNRVAVRGAHGQPRPDTLKMTVGFTGDWLGEGEISYAGPNAMARARLAAEILEARLHNKGLDVRRRFDLIGAVSVFDSEDGALRQQACPPFSEDIRMRLAVSADTKHAVELALQEVSALYCTGPAGGGGIRTRTQNRIRTVSYLVPRTKVHTSHYFLAEA